MANIREYDAPQNIGLQPTEMGIEARLKEAKVGGGYYDEAAKAIAQTGKYAAESIREGGDLFLKAKDAAVKHDESQEISHGSATFSNLNAGILQQWNDIAKTANPNDRSIAGQFRDEVVEPALEQFKDSFNTEAGKKYADTQAKQFRDHMFKTTSADMSTLAGDAAVINHKQLVNGLSGAVYSDPTSLDYSLKNLETSTTAQIEASPNLTPAVAAKVRTELLQNGSAAVVKSAALGFVEKTGQVPPWISDERYAPYLNADDLKTIETVAKVHQRANEASQKQTGIYDKQAAERGVVSAADNIVANHVSIDPDTSRPTIKPQYFKSVLAIAQKFPDAPNLGSVGRTMLDWGEYQASHGASDIASTPDAVKSITDRVVRGGVTQTDIMQAQVDGGLSDGDFAKMTRVANEVAADAKVRPWANTVRQDVATREPDALPEISTWLASTPNATRDVAAKRVDAVLAEHDAARNRQATATMPLPQFIGVPREQITIKNVETAQRRTLKAAKSGDLDLAAIAREATFLDRWRAAVGDR